MSSTLSIMSCSVDIVVAYIPVRANSAASPSESMIASGDLGAPLRIRDVLQDPTPAPAAP